MADYLEDIPDGYIRNRDKLVRKLREKSKMLEAQQSQQAAPIAATTMQ